MNGKLVDEYSRADGGYKHRQQYEKDRDKENDREREREGKRRREMKGKDTWRIVYW